MFTLKRECCMNLTLTTIGNKDAVIETIVTEGLSLPRGLMLERIKEGELLVDFFYSDLYVADSYLGVGVVTKNENDKVYGMVYVDQGCRGKGLGKALVSKLVTAYPEAIFTPWDKSSLALFKQLHTAGVLRDINFEPLSLGFITDKFELSGFTVVRR